MMVDLYFVSFVFVVLIVGLFCVFLVDMMSQAISFLILQFVLMMWCSTNHHCHWLGGELSVYTCITLPHAIRVCTNLLSSNSVIVVGFCLLYLFFVFCCLILDSWFKYFQILLCQNIWQRLYGKLMLISARHLSESCSIQLFHWQSYYISLSWTVI